MTATAWLAPWPWPNTGSRPWATKSVLALASAQTELVDLRGRSVIPGIIDSHNHAWEAGEFLRGLVTFGIWSIRELQQAVRAWAGTLGPGEWLHGGGFIEGRTPHRWNLDVAAPVVLERIFSTWVANFRALALAGITRDTLDPPGGEIGRNPATGEPTGILHRAAKLLVREVMPGPLALGRRARWPLASMCASGSPAS